MVSPYSAVSVGLQSRVVGILEEKSGRGHGVEVELLLA